MEKYTEKQPSAATDLATGEMHGEEGLRKDVDVAATFLATLDPSIINEPISAKEFSRLRWKIDLIILPLISSSIILGAVDKVIISNAKIYGLMTDNHLSSSQYSWVASILYFGSYSLSQTVSPLTPGCGHGEVPIQAMPKVRKLTCVRLSFV